MKLFIKSYYINKLYLSDIQFGLNYSKDFEIIILRDIYEFNQLKKKNYIFDDWDTEYIKNQLANKCIAISLFKENQLAHLRWIATSNASKKYVENWPININWKFEACWGIAYTLPKYRNNGLNNLSIKECIRFLKSISIKNVYFTVQKNNYVNLKSYKKYNVTKIGEGYFIYINRFLNFRFTKKEKVNG